MTFRLWRCLVKDSSNGRLMIIFIIINRLMIVLMMMMMMVRFVLKGAGYNPMDVLNCLMTRRGYKVITSVIIIIINTTVIFAFLIIFNVNNFNIIISTFFFIALLAPTGALVVAMCYYIHMYPPAFSDFHSVH